MSKKQLSIHSENILPIIKKWLYSEKDIFLRELVSNATDAIHKVKLLASQGKATVEEFRIDVVLNKEKKTLTISDNGIGMTSEEVEKYIAQIAFSGAEDFLKKYETGVEKDQIIGHFGLGFYSAYMVAEKVEITTLSYDTTQDPVFWSCDGTSSYTIQKGTRTKAGTDIILHLSSDNTEYLEEEKIRSILLHFCPFLPFPIFLNDKPLNNKPPLYLQSPSEIKDEEYLAFYHELYPLDPDPIFWIHLNVDYPFHLKGILYFPKITKNFDYQKSSIKLFCNRVFVSDHCKDIFADYLTILKGALDSPDIPLNVSRSFLQVDKSVRQLSAHISKKIADRLKTLYATEKEKFEQFYPDIELIIKLATLQDEKFYERSKEFLIWKNTNGVYTTLENYLARQKDKVFYTNDLHLSVLKLFQEKNIEVLLSESFMDIHLMNFLEDKMKIKFQRIDGDLDPALLDPSKEKSLLNSEGKSESAQIADFFRKNLNIKELEIEAKSLSSNTLPGFLLLKEEERRMRDYFQLQGHNFDHTKKTFIINTNSSLIANIIKISSKKPALAEQMVHQIYETALLSQKELQPSNLEGFINRSHSILEELTKQM
ncbi:MAG: molecular chaperone HtpG [Parachlamydiales bacterium]|nr:molecular chaperone HtpG [Parachlamydiales bacterium]